MAQMYLIYGTYGFIYLWPVQFAWIMSSQFIGGRSREKSLLIITVGLAIRSEEFDVVKAHK